MASFTPTVAMDDPRTTLGGTGDLPPTRDGGDDGRDDGSLDFATRLRRARLGMGVAVAGIVMIFVSFTSAYVVRQGLPTIDPRTNALVRDWIPVRLPALLLVKCRAKWRWRVQHRLPEFLSTRARNFRGWR